MKHYIYKKSHYMIQMTIPGIFTLLIGLYCTYQFLLQSHNVLYLFVIGICIYNVWNVFVSISNPSEIYIDDEKLIFQAFSKQHMYKFNEIENFAMRALAGNGKYYMTINNGGLFKGRYWVRTSEFDQEEELNDFFYDLDAKINPNSLFTTARKQGRQRLANQKKRI